MVILLFGRIMVGYGVAQEKGQEEVPQHCDDAWPEDRTRKRFGSKSMGQGRV